jgi:putative exporter of polyketide antibiotics
VLNLSPLDHVPGIPLEDLVLTPLVLLTLASVVLATGAFISFRQRDLVAN